MKFATFIRFTPQGLQSIDQTTARAAKFRESASAAGVQVDELLWLNGQFDGLMVFSAPDAEAASAVMLGLAKSGNVTTETMRAFEADEMDRIVSKAN